MEKDSTFFSPFMLHAIDLAKQWKWKTAPNPCVGAVLLKDDAIIAEGWHEGSGTPHAEAMLLNKCIKQGIDVTSCTLLVTLEPCKHYGKTPPCTEAIIASGIKHVVIGSLDPNSLAAGGADVLKEHGVTVTTGVEEEACRELITDFITWQSTCMPYTILKLAGTLDGRIATRSKHSKWISSEASRKNVHQLRRHMQAVIVGGKTFYEDNPLLTSRMISGEEYVENQPLAIVVTSHLPDSDMPFNLLRKRAESTIFWTTEAAVNSAKAEVLRKLGIRIVALDVNDNSRQAKKINPRFNLAKGLEYLRAELGCYYVLCEGGGKLGLSMLEDDLINEFHFYLAPKILGDNEAIPIFDGRSPSRIDEALQMRIVDIQLCDNDALIIMKQS